MEIPSCIFGVCINSFVSYPLSPIILVIWIFLAILSVVIARRKELSLRQKIVAGSIHLPLLLGSAAYFEYITKCTTLECFIKIAVSAILLYMATIFLNVFFILPRIFKTINKTQKVNGGWMKEFVEEYSKKFGIRKPTLYVLGAGKLVAASTTNIKSEIFLSKGLFKLLNRKEIESILLHELGHIKHRSPLLKLSTILLRVISPLARFSIPLYDLNMEEKRADELVEKMQNTRKYLESAKNKIADFRIH